MATENENHVIKPRCPKCASANVVSIIYGFPAFTEKLKKQLKNRELVLGGCQRFTDVEKDKWHCNECGYEFS